MKKLILILLTLLAISPVLAACPKKAARTESRSRATTTNTSVRTQPAHNIEEDEELSIFDAAPKSNPFKKKMRSWASQILIGCENFANLFRSR